MENAYSPHVPDAWLGRLSVHQDFFWFVSLLAWSLALILWWRHPERRTTWTWLAVPAFAAISTAVIQFGIFNPTLDIFQSRLIPGTVADYRPAAIDPYWLGDILQGFTWAGLAAWWSWLQFRRRKKVYLPLVVAAVALLGAGCHVVNPKWGGALLAAVTLVSASGFLRDTKTSRASRGTLVFCALLPVISTVGPIAAWTGTIQRFGPPTITGLVTGIFQMALGCVVLGTLARQGYAAMPAEKRATLWPDARGFVWAALVILVAGIVYGVVTGRDNRREILENRLRTTAAHSALFQPELLLPLESAEFWAVHQPGKDSLARNTLPNDRAEAARSRLLAEVVATPFLMEARILVVRDGWLIAALSSEAGRAPEYLRRATPEDHARWKNPKPHYEESPVPEIGYHYYSRAPILAPDGRMLGWLDAVRSEFYLTVARRWRAAPFIMTALGVVLLALTFAQHRSTRDREAALRAAAIAAESNRIKTTFFANVSHELRTPLQNILGYTELLQRELGEGAPRDRLAALQQQGELMTRLVNDLIDLSAADAGAFQLSPRAISPAEVVRFTVESLRPRAEAKHLGLRCAIEPRVPAWLWLDGERLRQVALNLTHNAVKFTEHGHVHVALDADHGTNGGVTLTLTVTDTGPGIPTEQQTRLFRPFSRLAQTAEKEGSGLGLALCAALCRTMGGDLRVESDGTRGSRFIATFSALPTAAPAEKTTVAVAPVPSANHRVLVVDDNTLMRELFAQFLRTQGATCAAAANGKQALEEAALAPWDVVLLDLALPDGSGADLVAPLRAHLPEVRIIGVSAHAGTAERERALAAGMDAFLVKPVALDQLWQTVTAIPAPTHVPKNTPPASATAWGNPGETPPALRAAFDAEFPEKLAALTTAVAAQDWPAIRAGAHYLRNSALVLAHRGLFDACTALETAADARDPAALARAWTQSQVQFAGLSETAALH